MKNKFYNPSTSVLQSKIKELEEKIATDEERQIAGFGNVGVLEEYDFDGDNKKVVNRQIVDLESGKKVDIVDTDCAAAEEQVRRKEAEAFEYIKSMEHEGLKRADEYKRYFENYERSLKNLEKCILNLSLCRTQTSLNFAWVSLWLEIEYVTTKIEILRGELKYNTFYAFCCNMNFREWAKKMRQYSEHIYMRYPEDEVADELYLKPLGSVPHAYLTPPNKAADDDTFSSLVDSMKPYGRSSSLRDFHALKVLSDNLLPVLYNFRESCDATTLKRGIESRLEIFSDDLDRIHLMISSPSLDNLRGVYYCFETDDDEIGKEVEAFKDANQNRASFVRLASERMKKLQSKQISKYCSEEEWHDLFDWSDNDCQPDYERLGEFIFKLREDDDRIEKAKEIVKLVDYWLHYNWAIMTFEEERKAENGGKELGNISVIGIPVDLMKYVLIQGKEELMKFAEFVRSEATKLRDEYGKEDFWDYFYFVCIHFKFIRLKPYKRKCSRAKFAEILSWLLYGSVKEAKNINYSMEKSGLQASKPENAIRHALKSEVGQNIKNHFENQSLA